MNLSTILYISLSKTQKKHLNIQVFFIVYQLYSLFQKFGPQLFCYYMREKYFCMCQT